MSGGMARTIRGDSLELWQGLVLHGMGEVDFHVFWKYWKLTSSLNTSKLVLGPTDWSSDSFGSGAHDIFWEWRTRYFLGVVHTICFGSGAHDIFWEWRTRFFCFGPQPPQPAEVDEKLYDDYAEFGDDWRWGC